MGGISVLGWQGKETLRVGWQIIPRLSIPVLTLKVLWTSSSWANLMVTPNCSYQGALFVGEVSCEKIWQFEEQCLHIRWIPRSQWNNVLETQWISWNIPVGGERILIMMRRKSNRKRRRNHSWYLFNAFCMPVAILLFYRCHLNEPSIIILILWMRILRLSEPLTCTGKLSQDSNPCLTPKCTLLTTTWCCLVYRELTIFQALCEACGIEQWAKCMIPYLMELQSSVEWPMWKLDSFFCFEIIM